MLSFKTCKFSFLSKLLTILKIRKTFSKAFNNSESIHDFYHSP